MDTLKSMPSHQEHKIKQRRLVFNLGITHNATPANKTYANDIPSLVVPRAQGQTAAADAIETISWTAPLDTTNSKFGILLNLAGNLADKVYAVSVVSAAGKSLTVTGPSAAAGAYLTAGGNIAIEVVAAALNLASADDTFTVSIDYREARP